MAQMEIQIKDKATEALTLFAPSTEQGASLIEIASRTGLPSDLVRHVQSSLDGATIRGGMLEDSFMFTTALSAELEAVAVSFTGAVNTKEMVWDEALDFIVSNYGFLNIHEIRHAFRLAASGDLGDINLRSYYGAFTISLLGEVLSAYRDRRKELYDAARRSKDVVLMVEQGDRRRAGHDVEAWKDNRQSFLLLLDSPSLDSVTDYDYEFLSERGHINLTRDQKWDFFDRAKSLVISSMVNEAGKSSTFVSRNIYAEIKIVQDGNPSEKFIARQKVVARRLAVVEWINSQRNSF